MTDKNPLMLSLNSHHRYHYQALCRQSLPCWPAEKGLALYVAINLEHFSFGCDEGAKLAPVSNTPDVLNYSWRDYGNRVGGWYLADLFRELAIPPAVITNTSVIDYCPALLDEWLSIAGSELIAHGYTNSQRQGTLTADDELRLIADSCERLRAYTAKPVNGWLSPWISESCHTPDFLVEQGFTYTLNWAHDDYPVPMDVKQGRLLSVPYPQEINDIPTIIPNGASAGDFCQMIEDQFAELLERSKYQPQVMGIALHPYIVGQPFRFYRLKKTLGHLMQQRQRFWLTTPGDIAQYINHGGTADNR